MTFKVEILSKELMIKPSSPTPPHLKTHKLSFLDQISPPIFVPLIFFFQDNEDDRYCTSELLKQSLSEILSQFYPLAGRLQGNTCVDCNDAGAIYIEAQVHGRLNDVIEDPSMEDLKKLLPMEPYGGRAGINDDGGQLILAVQVNYFLGGGLAVAVCMSHKVGDGLSIVNFVNQWALTAREGERISSSPNFERLSALFPPTDLPASGSGFTPSAGMTSEKLVTRRVVFDGEMLGELKKSAAGPGLENPTRVEALSAFLLKHFMGRNTTTAADVKNMFAAVHAVNLRGRLNPPLPDATFGNAWRPAVAVTPETTTHDLAFQVRSSIRKINGEYAAALENGKGYLESQLNKQYGMLRKGEVEFCSFSSWCRFPIYEVDFGWGRPVWACTTTMPFKNVSILMSTKWGDGIEAWVSMAEDDDLCTQLQSAMSINA